MGEDGVCIVGSGPTGVMAALALVEAGVPVMMIESGGTFPRRLHIRIRDVDLFRPAPPTVKEPVVDEDFITGGDGAARWIKAHSLGGLSNYWSGITLRFSPQDFSDGQRLHPRFRWPISFADLEPYYERVEELVGIRGGTESFEALPACKVVRERRVGPEWVKLAEACRNRGRSLTVLPDAHGPSTTLSTLGTPQNVAVRVLFKLRRMQRFRLISRAHVTRVLLDRHKLRATGVEYIDTRSGTSHKLASKAVILAAGPLSSTQILLNSKSPSFPEGLGNSQGLVGRYLHDHPLDYVQVDGDFRFRRLDDRQRGGLYITRQRYGDSPPLEANAFLLYGATFLGMTRYLFLLRHRYYFKVLKRMVAARHGSDGRYISPLKASLLYVCCFGTQTPRHDNRVSLDPDRKDRYGVPMLRFDTQYSKSELDNMKRARSFVPELLEEAGARVSRVSSELQTGGTSVHYGGTVRMHDSPEWGVLDGWNRLHDVRNVLVVDASCFTTCVEKNPSLTAMAISMRAAEKLAAERPD